jgi:ATP synthase protein I
MSSIPRPPIVRIPLIQGALLLPITIAAWFYDATASYSFFLGGCLQILPNVVFAVKIFRFRGALSSTHIFVSLFRGGAWKFVLSAIAFAVIFAYVKPLNMVFLFSAYIFMFAVATVVTAKILRSEKLCR